MDPASMIATGRTVPEHTSGLTVIDVHTVDPASCTGCGNATFRTLAYDSGTVRLVTLIPEILADQGAKPEPVITAARAAPVRQITRAAPPPEPAAAPMQAAKPAPVARKATAVKTEPTNKDYIPPQEARRLKEHSMALASGGCPRPRIIIDDYYPGGPLVPCKSAGR
jgi:pyruvate/2-oxoglutarate dehydrogenase complex dihydrolipoamide acyltransferase (E2) component